MTEAREYWDGVYSRRKPTEVSWFQPSPVVSLAMIEALGVKTNAPIVDVGGGASTLVDGLLTRQYTSVTVLDVAAPALDAARARLGDKAASVEWVVHDITTWRPGRHFALWHDRAVFHFLTTEDARAGYLAALKSGVIVGGSVIIATFALDGPETCSGLPVRRYDAALLAAELGPDFALEETRTEAHVTPGGSVQHFIYNRFRRTGS
jgi:hypothetical protein